MKAKNRLRGREPQLATTLLAGVLSCLVSCQVFEPTIKTLQEEPTVPADPTRSVLHLPAPQIEAPEPAPEPQPKRPTAHLKTTEGAEQKIKLEFRDTYLANAVHTIGEYAGVNLYLDASLDRKIDASFPSVKLDDALQTLLTRNGMQLVEEPAGIYWVTLADGNQPAERRFQLESARAEDVEPNLKLLVTTGAQIVVDKEQNFVIVRGKAMDVELVAEYLHSADRLKKQVLIEMRIVEITLGENFEFGVSHNFPDIPVGDNALSIFQNFATPSTNFSMEFAANNGTIDSTLQALANYTGVELLSSPRVVAVNNTKASIEIIREVPYINASTSVSTGTTSGTGSSSTTEVAFKDAGIKLEVKPAIRSGGVIEFEVTQDLSEVGEVLGGVPAIDHRKLTSRFQVRDGSTLVVGGLMQDRKSKADAGIPFLMDLPFVGALFKNKQDAVNKRELLIFLSPRIVSFEAADDVSDRWRQVLDDRRREMGFESKAPHEGVDSAPAAGGTGAPKARDDK